MNNALLHIFLDMLVIFMVFLALNGFLKFVDKIIVYVVAAVGFSFRSLNRGNWRPNLRGTIQVLCILAMVFLLFAYLLDSCKREAYLPREPVKKSRVTNV